MFQKLKYKEGIYLNSVRELRKSKGLKQEDIAKIIGTSMVNYSKKENGIVRFSLIEAKLLSDFFSLPIEEIFFEGKVSKIEIK